MIGTAYTGTVVKLLDGAQGGAKAIIPSMWERNHPIAFNQIVIFAQTTPANQHSFTFYKDGVSIGAVTVTTSGNYWRTRGNFVLFGQTNVVTVRHDTNTQDSDEMSGTHADESSNFFAGIVPVQSKDPKTTAVVPNALWGELSDGAQGTERLILPALFMRGMYASFYENVIFLNTRINSNTFTHSFTFTRTGASITGSTGTSVNSTTANYFRESNLKYQLKGLEDYISVRHDTNAQDANETTGQHRDEGIRFFAGVIPSRGVW